MIFRRWIEGFKSGNSDVIGMICCEIGLVFGSLAAVSVGIGFAIKEVFPDALRTALIFLVPGIVISVIALLIILGVAVVQLFKVIVSPSEQDGRG